MLQSTYKEKKKKIEKKVKLLELVSAEFFTEANNYINSPEILNGNYYLSNHTKLKQDIKFLRRKLLELSKLITSDYLN